MWKASSLRRAFFVLRVAVVVFAVAPTIATALTITSPFFLESHTGPNPLGLPTGDLMQVGAFIVPSGPPTVATATQGAIVLNLSFTPHPIFPNDYENVFPFDPALMGAWEINATRGIESAGPVLTPSIPVQRVVPLVDDLRVVGVDLTPTLLWEWPAVMDFQAYGARVIDFATGLHLYQQFVIAPPPAVGTTGMFEIPDGVLELGRSYIFRITLLETLGEGSTAQAVSATYTQAPFAPVPEPPHYALLGIGILSLVLCHFAKSRNTAKRLRRPRASVLLLRGKRPTEAVFAY